MPRMAAKQDSAVSVETTAAKLPEGVLEIDALEPESQNGCTVFVHYNGPTDQLSGVCTGMAALDPGASPPPVHPRPEEGFLLIAAGPRADESDRTEAAGRPRPSHECARHTPHARRH